MGTRSLTHIHDGYLSAPVLTTIYRQFDGYPDGLGKELSEFLSPIEIVNGISDRSKPIANGMGCLAAQIIKHLKEEVGNVYLYPPGSKDCGEEFTYRIYLHKGEIWIKCLEEPIDCRAAEFSARIPVES